MMTKLTRHNATAVLFAIFALGTATHVLASTVPGGEESKRVVISLDGTWQIAEGKMEQVPVIFDHTVPVPGLVSLATPGFDAPGPKVVHCENISEKDAKRDAFWYRRTFTFEGAIPAVAKIKVRKAMFGTRVFLNGKLLGDHAPSFTIGYFDALPGLKTGVNEILIRVGADRDAVGRAYPDGFDFEKQRYIPGIFDSVEMVLSGTPHFLTVQTAPDIGRKTVRMQAVLRNDSRATKAAVKVLVREAKTGNIVGRQTSESVELAKGAETTLDVSIPIPDCRLWSPEDPFLYVLEADSGGDTFRTRFGMREFKFDPATGRAMLNGKPYYLRGSNITLYRFFEDSECGKLPWDQAWVRLLHERVRGMHWNCLRYCIGFPPEAWYDIADETGILIDDEFPIWYGGDVPKEMQSDELAKEYAEWMRERWNHPSVVIWDACNETLSPKTGAAFKQVRAMDLSDRPWDNGYTPPQKPGDMLESHPYHFSNPNFKLANLAAANGQAGDGKHSVVINEYGWLWLNRDGSPTTLTKQLYQNLLGPNSTAAQRFHLQATYTAAETEFWRAHRKSAAVMHFTTLGYSRSDGQTSDHWTEGGVAKLQWEPEFYRYVRDAFAPVGLMLDCWNSQKVPGTKASIPVTISNDLDQIWQGPVTLRLKLGEREIFKIMQECRLEPLGQANATFNFVWPVQAGAYVLEAELRGEDGTPVKSVRDLEILDVESLGLAFGKSATASSVHSNAYKPENAVDSDSGTYWSSEFKDGEWLAIDLGEVRKISRVRIQWEAAFAKSFSLQLSTDGKNWSDVYKTDDGKGGFNEIKFSPTEARWVRLNCIRRGTIWGNAVYEIGVFEK